MQPLPCKIALLSILLTFCINSQGLPFYFDPLGTLGGGSFNPLSIPDCGLWLDASDASTVQLSGVSVTNWINKAVDGTSARVVGPTNTYPSFCSSELNGKCTVYFDGADYLKTQFFSATGTTVFIVAKITGGEIIIGARDSTDSRSFWGNRSGGFLGAGVGADPAIVSVLSWGTSYRLFSGKYNKDFVYIYDGGTNILTKTQVGTGANFIQGYFVGGANLSGTLGIPSTCYVAEIICYRKSLSDTDMDLVESYLMRKWFH